MMLNIGQKMFKVQKVTVGQLKIRKLYVTLATWNYLEFLVLKFDSTSSWFKKKSFFQKDLSWKNEMGDKNAPV